MTDVRKHTKPKPAYSEELDRKKVRIEELEARIEAMKESEAQAAAFLPLIKEQQSQQPMSTEAIQPAVLKTDSIAIKLPHTIIHDGTIAWARAKPWTQYKKGGALASFIYKLLGERGLGADCVRRDFKVFGGNRKKWGLSETQIRLAYGREHGLFDDEGRFQPHLDDPKREVDREFQEFESKHVTKGMIRGGRFEDRWEAVRANAVNHCCGGKPDEVAWRDEFRWVRSNLYRWPDFKTAPSVAAITTWLSVSKPGNEMLLRSFILKDWAHRLPPEPRVERPKAEVDNVEDPELADWDERLEERLAGAAEGGA